jgi:hypothetical protein
LFIGGVSGVGVEKMEGNFDFLFLCCLKLLPSEPPLLPLLTGRKNQLSLSVDRERKEGREEAEDDSLSSG